MSSSSSPPLSTSYNRSIHLSQKRKRDVSDLEITYFNEVLKTAGLSLEQDDGPNIITQEQSLVVRDIIKTLQSHISYPTNTKEFTNGLKTFCNREENFKNALSPTELRKPDSSSSIEQDSTIRILLNVFCVQDEVIELLLKHVTDCAIEENNDTTFLRLLLNPLRYLAHINNSKAFTTKLIDILEVASYTPQLELLNLIPEIIPDIEYEETAKQLSKLLDDNPDLTGAIVDCLNSLDLNTHIRSEIQEQVLSQLDSPSSAKVFPVLFEFVVGDCSSKDLQNILLQVRNALDLVLGQSVNKKDLDSNKALVCCKVQSLTIARKTLFDGWLTLIGGIRSHTQVKPVDILILFMLHSIAKSKHSVIELLIRKRIKSGLFKITHLETLFKNYFVTQTMKDYFSSIIEIANSLLRFYTETTLTDFSEAIYKSLFSHKLIERLQQQDIVYNLMLLTGRSDKKSTRSVLKVLLSLGEDHEKLQQHAVQLMGLLEKLDTIYLNDVKIVFEILCNLTCGEKSNESMSGLKDEIHMVIRKQLSSSKKVTKHRGIIASIVMIKVLASTSEDVNQSADIEDSIVIEDLPSGGPREAAVLLEFTNTCTLGCPESVGLLYDELAYMIITASNTYQVFMAWLYQMFTNDFQNIFVVEKVPAPINDIDITMQFSLNTNEEIDTPISVNIAELTLKSQFYEHSSVLILAPLFRLLRLIHYKQHDGDLSSIDALLGCPVILPNLSDINNYDMEQLKQVSDCVFHCINWFRELINAFITQRSRKLRTKVLNRISDTIKLQEVLEECIEFVPDHELPCSYFDTVSQATKQLSSNLLTKTSKPKKKQKVADTTTNINETVASTSAATQKTRNKVTVKKKKDYNFQREFKFRDLDTDILLLLRYQLKLEGIHISSTQISQSQILTIDINQFIFLMSDFVLKLNALIKGKDLVSSHITMIKLEDLIMDCAKLFVSIKRHFKTIATALRELVESVEGCLDSEQLFSNYAKQLKVSFGLIIQSYALVFGWSGFQHPKHLQLLKDCLKSLLDEEQAQLISVKGIIMEFTRNLLENVDYCLSLSTALNLINLLQVLYVLHPNPELKKQIVLTSGSLLNRKWYNDKRNLEVGKEAFLCMNELIKAYLSNATAKTICGMVGTLQEQVTELKTKDDSLEMLISINKGNFHIFYRNLCIALLETIRTEITSLTNNEHLNLWKFTALSMQGLMTVVKTHESKVNLISYLKNCIEVLEIFKMMQTSTRFLHHISCYSKFKKDVSLVSYVPQFRQVLESLLYRVKAALVANNCSDAFWMGTLKNKNLHGEDILSQSTVRSDENEPEAMDVVEDDEDIIASDNDSTSSDVV
ncbi:hypothetical protein FQR65_LT12328 [Abscondita terminalis]|nr:hypothetical protein FQR65_LT12328 [Abscondita terminalis]